MKILQLCYKPPYPPVDGGTLAMNSITQGLLKNGHQVKVLSICSSKHPVRHEALEGDYTAQTAFESVFVDLDIHPLDAAVALLCGESYHVKRFVSKEFDRRLSEILQAEKFDVIHVESIFLTPYLPTMRRLSNAPIVMRAHNVEHLIWRRIALSTSNPLKRWYLKKLALALRHYELEHINDYNGIVCISQHDADYFHNEGCRKPITAIPFGIDIPETDHAGEETGTLFHIGSMDWRPNEDGIRWFLKEVWPMVHAEMPHLKLYLAGRRMPNDLMANHPEGVVVVGEVDDATRFMASKQVNIVPLFAGSGIRIKIIEAMSLGKTVISTTIGAEGIDYEEGKEILIANNPETFVKQIHKVYTDTELCQMIGDNAHKLIAEKYNIDAITQQLTDFYNKLPR